MAINIHLVGEERWVLAKQMRDYLRILERVSKQGKVDSRSVSEAQSYEAVLRLRFRGLGEWKPQS